MIKVLRIALFWSAVLLFSACGPADGGTITAEGVGKITFDQEIPEPGKGYTAEAATMYFDSEEGFPYFVVKDKSGHTVAEVFPGQSISVYAPQFKTTAGIFPGMNLHEAARITGEENLYIWLGWPNNYFTVEDATTGFTWNIAGEYISGGAEKFQEITLHGTPVTLAHFEPDAVIGSITIVNQIEEPL
ncbi:MAG: hypothetical protein LUD68_11265 [Rikenellaceae bacterium]|nr:hypothetical protein [Rikenellaceae bacterium]